jgi:hypothetical protein
MELRSVPLIVLSCIASTACAQHAAVATTPAQHVMLAEATPAPATPPPGQPASSETTDERHSRHAARTLGWISISIGAAGGLLALGTSILMLEDNGTRNSNCTNKVCNTAGFTANGQLSDLGPWNLGAWVVAAAGLGAGAYLLLTNPSDSSRQTQVGVGPTGSGAGLLLRSSF